MLSQKSLLEHKKVSRRVVDLFLSAKNNTTTTQQQQQKEMKTKKKNSNDDDDTNFIKVSSKLLQGLRLSPSSSSSKSEEERTVSSSPSKRMMRLERKTSGMMFPLKKRVGLKKEAHQHPRCWSATSSSGEDDEGGEEEDDEYYWGEQCTPWSSSRASFDEEEKEKDYYSRMNEEWCGTQMMDLDQFCANVKTTAVGESDDVEKSRSTTSFLTTEKITKRLLEGWSLARETCSECEMPMMRRNARRGDARWMDEVVCVECEDRDDEPRERFGRRRPGERLALMEGKPRPPVGTKAFATLYRGSNYSGEDQEELSPTSVL